MRQIGFSWTSPEGRREVVAVEDRPRGRVYGVATNASKTLQLIPESEIEMEIRRDEANAASRGRAHAQQQQRVQDTTAHDSWFGFTETLASPVAKRRAIDTLNKQVSIRREIGERGALIRDLVQNGWTVQQLRAGRVLQAVDGAYLIEKDLTKIGLDFAEYLSDGTQVDGLSGLEGGRRPTLVNEAGVDAETLRLGAEGLRAYFRRFGGLEETNRVARYRFVLTEVAERWDEKTFIWRTEPLYGRVAEEKQYGRQRWFYRKPEKRVVEGNNIPENPEWAYRGMSWGEWKNIRKTGFIQSKGEWNMGDAQKDMTLFGEASTARSYACGFTPEAFKPSRKHPGVVIAIPKDLTHQPAIAIGSNEFYVKGRLPASHIQAVWFLIATEISEGSFDLKYSYLTKRWSTGSSFGLNVYYTIMQAYPEEML